MRNMVRSAEQERNSALKQQELQTRQHAQVTSEEVSSQGVKLNSLEREHEQLKATQALAEVLAYSQQGRRCIFSGPNPAT